MFHFRNLIVTIAGLWALCLIQNQIHPHPYINFSKYSDEAHLVRSPQLNDHAVSVLEHKPLAHDLPLFTFTDTSDLTPQRWMRSFRFSTQNDRFILKNYRIFLTGLSPPSLSRA